MFKKIAAVTLVASLMAGSGLAYAQSISTDVGAGVSGGAQVESGAMGTKAGANTNASTNANATMTLGSVVSSINNKQADFTKLDEANNVEIVELADLKGVGAENNAAIEGAVKSNMSTIEQLHAAIEANAEVKQELEDEGFEVKDVVAMNAEVDGSVTLYVWDQA